MDRKRLTIASFILIIFAVYIVGSVAVSNARKLSSATIHSSGPAGTSIFYALADKLNPNTMHVLSSAVLDAKTLKDFSLLMLISPKAQPSMRELTIISEHIEKGGVLFASFHDEDTFKRLQPLFTKLKIDITPLERPQFENGVTVEAVSDNSIDFLKPGATLSLYSLQHLTDCGENALRCYLKQFTAKKGRVYVFSGLVPFSNALIAKQDNRKFAFELLDAFDSIAIDEYHHFFTEKTYIDLMLDPTFAAPLLGMVTLAILFFLFGHSNLQDFETSQESKNALRSNHDLHIGLLQSLLKKGSAFSDAVQQQRKFLLREFPEHTERIESIMQRYPANHLPTSSKQWYMQISFDLLQLHKTILEERGKRVGEA